MTTVHAKSIDTIQFIEKQKIIYLSSIFTTITKLALFALSNYVFFIKSFCIKVIIPKAVVLVMLLNSAGILLGLIG